MFSLILVKNPFFHDSLDWKNFPKISLISLIGWNPASKKVSKRSVKHLLLLLVIFFCPLKRKYYTFSYGFASILNNALIQCRLKGGSCVNINNCNTTLNIYKDICKSYNYDNVCCISRYRINIHLFWTAHSTVISLRHTAVQNEFKTF